MDVSAHNKLNTLVSAFMWKASVKYYELNGKFRASVRAWGLISAVGLDRGRAPKAGAGPGLRGGLGATLVPDYPATSQASVLR